MNKRASSQKKVPTEVWVALIGLIGVVLTALLTSPILIPIIQRTPAPSTNEAANLEGPSANPPASPSTTVAITPKPVDESTVIVTLQNGSHVEFPMNTLYTNFGDGESLSLYNGVKIPFTKMKSFEIVEDNGEDNITVTIILLDGQTQTKRIDKYAASDGEIQGGTSIGPFRGEFHELKKVEFQR